MADKEFESVNLNDLIKTNVETFAEKVKNVKEMKFDNSSLIKKKNIEIEKSRQILAQKLEEKNIELEKELQVLNIELNKDLSQSNEVLYTNNAEFDKLNKTYNIDLKSAKNDHQNKLAQLLDEKEKIVSKENERHFTALTKIDELRKEKEQELDLEQEKLNEKYAESKKIYQNNIKRYHDEYQNQVTLENKDYLTSVKATEPRKRQINQSASELAKFEASFTKIENSYADRLSAATDKGVINTLKKELDQKRKEFESRKKGLNASLNAMKDSLAKDIDSFERKHLAKLEELKSELYKNLVEEDHMIYSYENKYNCDSQVINEHRRGVIDKHAQEKDSENERNKTNLKIITNNYQIDVLKLEYDYSLKLINLEMVKTEAELANQKVKTEQTYFRAVAKKKLENNSQITKLRNEFATKMAEAEEIKAIQTSKSEIIIDKTDVQYSKVKENYLITDHFHNLVHEALSLQNTQKLSIIEKNPIRQIVTTKLKEINDYIDNLIEMSNKEYQNITDSLIAPFELELEQLKQVQSLAKDIANNQLDTLTKDNIDKLVWLHQEKLNCLKANHLQFVTECEEYKKKMAERAEEEIEIFNLFTTSFATSLENLSNRVEGLSKESEKTYKDYLQNFHKCSENNLLELANSNTTSLNRINLSMEENNQILEKEIGHLRQLHEQDLKKMEEDKEVAVAKIVEDQNNLTAKTNNKINSLNQRYQQEVDIKKNEASNHALELSKVEDYLSKMIKTIDDRLKSNINLVNRNFASNLDKSTKGKNKLLKNKNIGDVLNAESKWWQVKEEEAEEELIK